MNVILFDGVCNLCNGTVNWIIDRDKKDIFRFASLQSEYGQRVIEKFNLGGQYLESIIFIEDSQVYLRSAAVLRILKLLGGVYSLLYIFIVIPSPLRDFFYNIVAKYRYSWFGRRNTCRIPDNGLKQKFLE